MTLSRRSLNILLPTLAATAMVQDGKTPRLTTKVYHDGQIPYQGNETKKSRRFFNGTEHSGFRIETHETVLGPGIESHAPHQHEHEELIILVEGALEAYLDGKKEPVEAGSIIYFGPNQMHNIRNTGTKACRYYVVELRGHES